MNGLIASSKLNVLHKSLLISKDRQKNKPTLNHFYWASNNDKSWLWTLLLLNYQLIRRIGKASIERHFLEVDRTSQSLPNGDVLRTLFSGPKISDHWWTSIKLPEPFWRSGDVPRTSPCLMGCDLIGKSAKADGIRKETKGSHYIPETIWLESISMIAK